MKTRRLIDMPVGSIVSTSKRCMSHFIRRVVGFNSDTNMVVVEPYGPMAKYSPVEKFEQDAYLLVYPLKSYMLCGPNEDADIDLEGL